MNIVVANIRCSYSVTNTIGISLHPNDVCTLNKGAPTSIRADWMCLCFIFILDLYFWVPFEGMQQLCQEKYNEQTLWTPVVVLVGKRKDHIGAIFRSLHPHSSSWVYQSCKCMLFAILCSFQGKECESRLINRLRWHLVLCHSFSVKLCSW